MKVACPAIRATIRNPYFRFSHRRDLWSPSLWTLWVLCHAKQSESSISLWLKTGISGLKEHYRRHGKTSLYDANVFFNSWVTCYDIPRYLVTGNGPHFVRKVFAAVCMLLKVKHLKRRAYYYQTNGKVERINWKITSRLRYFVGSTNRVSHLCPSFGWRIYHVGALIDIQSIILSCAKQELILTNHASEEAGVSHRFLMPGIQSGKKKSIRSPILKKTSAGRHPHACWTTALQAGLWKLGPG